MDLDTHGGCSEGLLASGWGVDDEPHMEDYAARAWRVGEVVGCVVSWWFAS